MKKIYFILITILTAFTMNVEARECTFAEIESYHEIAKNINYNLEYATDYMDMNGDFQEGYFKLIPVNLPDNYYMSFKTEYGMTNLSNADFMYVTGGVYNVKIYNDVCSNSIRSFDVKIPYYNKFCETNSDCKQSNHWYDGTTEPLIVKVREVVKSTISGKIILLVSSAMVIFIIVLIFVFLRRRKKYEK